MIVVNKYLKKHSTEKIVNAFINMLPDQDEDKVIPPKHYITIKQFDITEKELRRKNSHKIKYSSFTDNNEYVAALKAIKEYQVARLHRDFHNEQVNGTIFAHEGTEGDIL